MKRLAIGAVLVAFALGCVLVRLNHATRQAAFMGDSLTLGWGFPRANFGVNGQTSTQMLARFETQMPGHQIVIVLAGTNDTLLGIDQKVTFANLGRMADLARAEGAEPIMAKIPPIYKSGGQYMPAVRSLNAGIVALASSKGVKVVDYYNALEGEESSFSDGTHLKQSGYLRMEWALMRTKDVF